MEQLLQKSEIFRDFPADVILRDILPQGQLAEYNKDQWIIEPQQKVDSFSILVSGKVNILHLFPDGSFSLVAALGSPEILGTDLICTRSRLSPYHAIAATAATLITFPARLILEPGHMDERWRLEAIGKLLTTISHHNMKKEYRLAILSQKGLRERIMTYLLMQSGKRRTNSFRIPFTREEMASFLCVNRSALSHELSLMEQEGLISFRKNVFTLHAPEKWSAQNTYEL